jgi:hypothetical protein
MDLTVPDAAPVRDFYAAVLGWRPEPVDMGGYSDFTMIPAAGGDPAAGVCHARGENADLPPVWLVYFTVEDLGGALESVVAGGGSVIRPPGEPNEWGRFAVIRDPAGAACALFEAGPAYGQVHEAASA